MQLSQGPAYQAFSSFLTNSTSIHFHMSYDTAYDLKGIGYNLEAIRGIKIHLPNKDNTKPRNDVLIQSEEHGSWTQM
jgi:hypothetical protein